MTDADTVKEDLKLVKRVDEFGKNLTEWETDLVESCLRRLLEDVRPLSEKQREVMERLDREKVE